MNVVIGRSHCIIVSFSGLLVEMRSCQTHCENLREKVQVYCLESAIMADSHWSCIYTETIFWSISADCALSWSFCLLQVVGVILFQQLRLLDIGRHNRICVHDSLALSSVSALNDSYSDQSDEIAGMGS